MSLASPDDSPFRRGQRPELSSPLRDLPTDLILETYKAFDHISQIVALNSTSRVFYEITRVDPGPFSDAVLPRSIACHDTVV
ncbi:hypothetical protein HO173_012102 [Letharia columbiana]|uniref:F-box domain-containing protein n=1 Tax=Letharia columbiana TaxID=112416 RepID=A0A8H6FGG9_9LECA|nr:uncharacterized protein HO173_012102 [Letharia columbiana]KAF6227662.1 hypothetical protein HO173_012102 [Letharia columbiana]